MNNEIIAAVVFLLLNIAGLYFLPYGSALNIAIIKKVPFAEMKIHSILNKKIRYLLSLCAWASFTVSITNGYGITAFVLGFSFMAIYCLNDYVRIYKNN